MFTCPHCRQVLPEPLPAACPVCFGAIGAPTANPSPYAATAASPGQPPGGRISLTGEVIPVEPPPPFPGTGVANQPQSTPTHAVAAAPAYRRTPQRETVKYSSRNNALLINVTVIFVLIAGAAGGAAWMWMHRTNPKAQVERYLHAIQWLDWGVVWDLSATRPGNQSRREFISKNDEPYEGNGVLRIGARHSYEQYTFQVGEPTINGDQATLTATIADRSVEFKLKNFGGIWKIYPLKADPLEILRGYNEEEQKKKLEADLKSAFEKIKDESGRKDSGHSGLPQFR